MAKRLFDLALAIPLLTIALLVLVLLMFIIRLQSKGPAIFAQQRVGRHQKIFTCYKLRTMASDTKNLPSHEVSSSAITSVGQVLRMTKLDELPQLYNVIRGDMSLVGPRPCLPSQSELINAREVRGVFGLRPGISGLAQVQKIDMSNPERLADMDAQYAQRMNLWLDIRILAMTVLGSGLASDAARN